MTPALLALGGNIGDVTEAFIAALRMLEQGGAKVSAASSVYRTPPWGVTDQPDFLNMAIAAETGLSAQALLDLCLSIERASGRVRDMRWGPRNIDIDIIAFGNERIDEPDLTIPHPHAHERAFVLAPLAEIAADDVIGGQTIGALAQSIDASGVQRDDNATARLRAAGY